MFGDMYLNSGMYKEKKSWARDVKCHQSRHFRASWPHDWPRRASTARRARSRNMNSRRAHEADRLHPLQAKKPTRSKTTLTSDTIKLIFGFTARIRFYARIIFIIWRSAFRRGSYWGIWLRWLAAMLWFQFLTVKCNTLTQCSLCLPN
jgi:hypothetical protein